MNIRRFIASAAIAFLASVSAFAGKVETFSIHSNVLGADVKYNVYIPSGFKADGEKYPIIYLLHGLSGNYTNWEERGHVSLVADELIRSGECKPVVIVMPNAGGKDKVNVWNGYFNMPGWRYEDFFFGEFMEEVEKKFNAGGSKGMRAIMGLSMGGGGSTVYCQRHPELFSSCYAMSAWLDNSDTAGVKIPEEQNKLYYVCKSVRENSALDFVKNASPETVEALKTVNWFIDCGDDDFLFDYSAELHILMRDRKIKNELRVRDGVHNWEYWRTALRLSLPFASRNFSK